jgi:hypothetical protein
VPQLGPGGDLSFSVPSGGGWTDATGVLSTVTRLMPTGTLGGERVLGAWRLLGSGGVFVYVEAVAIDLASHPDVKSLDDLAALKFRFVQRDSDAFQAGETQRSVVGGQPAVIADSVVIRRFPGDPGASGRVSTSELNEAVTRVTPDSPVTELIWAVRDVVTIRGNWGYDFRLFSTSAAMKSASVDTFNQLLAGLTFNY